MSCKYELCKDWSWDGCGWGGVHNFSGSIPNIVWSCNGGCCNGVTSYSTRSETQSGVRVGSKNGGGECEDTQLIAYEKPNYTGHSQPMRGQNRRINRISKPGCGEDWWSSIKETKIPKTMTGKLPRQDTDAECPGATNTYKKVGGKINACFYKDDDESKIRKVFDQKGGNAEMSVLFNNLKEGFCKLSKNVFKNPGGGPCLEYDTAKELAKEYCSVGNRIAKDASCTPTNLGNFYADIAERYCKTAAGKADVWCSCYNVTNNVCDTDSAAAGCDKKRQQFDKLVEATPEGFRNVWSGRAACFGGVCQGDKYVPQNANQNCNAPVQICAQSFDLSQISESTIEAQCNLTATTGTPSSAGGTPSGTPPTTPSGTPPGTPSGGIGDYIPQSLGDVRNDSKKQLAVGGVGALFMLCCCLLIIIVLMSSSGGGGRGPSRFRR
jgi:hypothetical protein